MASAVRQVTAASIGRAATSAVGMAHEEYSRPTEFETVVLAGFDGCNHFMDLEAGEGVPGVTIVW